MYVYLRVCPDFDGYELGTCTCVPLAQPSFLAGVCADIWAAI